MTAPGSILSQRSLAAGPGPLSLAGSHGRQMGECLPDPFNRFGRGAGTGASPAILSPSRRPDPPRQDPFPAEPTRPSPDATAVGVAPAPTMKSPNASAARTEPEGSPPEGRASPDAVGGQPRSSGKLNKKAAARARRMAAKQAAERERTLKLAGGTTGVLGALALLRRSRFWTWQPSCEFLLTLCACTQWPRMPPCPPLAAQHPASQSTA